MATQSPQQIQVTLTKAQAEGEHLARCDDCQEKWPVSALKEPQHLEERMDHPRGHPDRIEPAGECPACGALAYAI